MDRTIDNNATQEPLWTQLDEHLVLTLPASFIYPHVEKIHFDHKLLKHIKHISVDLASCQNIDSSGIGVLVMVYRLSPQASHDLLGATSSIESKLKVVRLDNFYNIHINNAA